MNVNLTGNRDELFIALTQKVKLFSLPMIGQMLWPSTGRSRVAQARRFAQAEIRRGLLTHHQVLCPKIPKLVPPLLRWQAGYARPLYSKLSYRARGRWGTARPTTVVTATSKAAAFYGGVPGRIDQIAVAHDLVLSAAFLIQDSGTRRFWMGEAVYAKSRVNKFGAKLKCPDALLVSPDGVIIHCHESAGAYDAAHLRSFHEDYIEKENIPSYTLW